MTPKEEALLDTISNYKTLPKKEQKRLRPLLDETIQRHKELDRSSKIISEFLKEYNILRSDYRLKD